MLQVEAYKVDAFTTQPFRGNAAGVVPVAAALTEAQMQAMAREMNVSETAFLMPPSQPGAHHRLRFFTPTSEVRLCGHATVATFHLLAETRRIPVPYRAKLETGAGVLDIEVRAGPEVYLTSDPVVVKPSPLSKERVAQLLGIGEEHVSPRGEPILLVKGMLFVTLSGLKAMELLQPDLRGIAEEYRRNGIDGFVPVSLETRDPEARTHIRYFVPGVGIDEDPVTGAAHMALAGYLLRTGQLDLSSGPARFVGEQGDFCGRPGKVVVEVEGSAETPKVRIGGRAVTSLAGAFRLP